MATTPTELVAGNVRAEMGRAQKSQAQIGDRLGLSQTAVSARLRGKTPFDVNEIYAIAEFLNVPVMTLMVGVSMLEPVAS